MYCRQQSSNLAQLVEGKTDGKDPLVHARSSRPVSKGQPVGLNIGHARPSTNLSKGQPGGDTRRPRLTLQTDYDHSSQLILTIVSARCSRPGGLAGKARRDLSRERNNLDCIAEPLGGFIDIQGTATTGGASIWSMFAGAACSSPLSDGNESCGGLQLWDGGLCPSALERWKPIDQLCEKKGGCNVSMDPT